MTTLTVPVRGPVKCKHCPAVYRGDEQSARVAGWRIWRGQTMGGKPGEDVVCAACAGSTTSAEQDADGTVAGWRVHCSTCHWDYEDEDGDGPLTAKEAKHMARDHECEPEVEIAPPSGDQWYDEYHITDDGAVKEQFR